MVAAIGCVRLAHELQLFLRPVVEAIGVSSSAGPRKTGADQWLRPLEALRAVLGGIAGGSPRGARCRRRDRTRTARVCAICECLSLVVTTRVQVGPATRAARQVRREFNCWAELRFGRPSTFLPLRVKIPGRRRRRPVMGGGRVLFCKRPELKHCRCVVTLTKLTMRCDGCISIQEGRAGP